ncbi:hypothetical protein DTL42_12120 [Bremerella cremea]|uniref:Uncharacterized protein n=1 Tax=Bremerella cremea TaxID=1031537 RepID=A0A368KR43_9BACT|nr:hypothetical protein [Bremerella cremea]RCS49276.1 hypothetical protein DTL42_12120 [Bremerella cremea]
MIRSVDSADGDSDDDRFFEAVRYLLDEMSPEESSLFEEQLATDQSLREILAEAVQLTQTTYEAFVPLSVPSERTSVASPSTVAPGNGNTKAKLFLALAASLLVAVVGGLWLYQNAPHQEIALPSTTNEEVQLASAWADHFEAQTGETSALWDDELLTLPAGDIPLEENADDALLASSPSTPPAWMLKALAAEQEKSASRPAM